MQCFSSNLLFRLRMLTLTTFLYNPWCFEIPLAFKPTFLNMDLDFNDISVANFIVDIHWNLFELKTGFWGIFELSCF